MNNLHETITKIYFGNVTQADNSFTELEVEASVEPTALTPPVHRLDFLTIIIPFFFLCSLSVVIFLLNLFKASISSTSSGPWHRYAPDIHIIEPTRSVAPREVISEHGDENGYLKTVTNMT